MRILVFEPAGSEGAAAMPGAGSRDDPLPGRRLRDVLTTAGLEPVRVTSPAALEREAPSAEAIMLWFHHTPTTAAVRALSRSMPRHTPLLVVSPEPPKAALAFGPLRVEAFLSTEEVEVDLSTTVRRVTATSLLGRARVLVSRASHLSAPLRDWMAEVLTAWPPHRTVEEAATAVGLARSTVRRHWRGEVGCSSAGEFLRWVRLVRVTLLKTPWTPWSEVARALGVSRRTLRRHARELAGVSTLEELAGDGARVVREGYTSYLRRALLESPHPR